MNEESTIYIPAVRLSHAVQQLTSTRIKNMLLPPSVDTPLLQVKGEMAFYEKVVFDSGLVY